MSAQNSPRRRPFSGLIGFLGFSAIAGLLVTVMVAPAIAVTGITASSTIGVFDSLPEYINVDRQAERNEIWSTFTGPGNVNGHALIATIYDQNREEVPYSEMSPNILHATVDGEDERFFDHGGVDPASVARAALGNFRAGGVESGASTLSMQLVKNINVQEALDLPTEEEQKEAFDAATKQGIDRKLKEMKLAIGLEKKYTKKEILAAYLNIANFGNATYGIQAAAQRYYSTTANKLTIAQAASLAAIVQTPSDRNPGDPENYEANQERRDYIIDKMYEAKHITAAERDKAKATPVDDTTVKLSSPKNGCLNANEYSKWFCDYVVRNVPNFDFLGNSEQERAANWKKGGYKLYTTLDLDIQIPAQVATWSYAPNTETAFELGSATSTVQPGTGRVLVMSQNKVFNDTLDGGGPTATAVNFNTARDYGGSSGFQPGSTYKVFTLLDWLKEGKGVNERVNGNPRDAEPFGDYRACGEQLGGGTFPFGNNANERGTYTVRDGTVNSINGVFFSMAKQLDLCDIRDTAKSLGVERADGDELGTNPTSVIGTNEVTPLSMAGAYAAIAADGKYCKPIIVDSFTNPEGANKSAQKPSCVQALAPNIADTAIDVLKGVMTSGNQVYSNPNDGIPIFGKTGTTDDAKHTWMATGTTKAGTVVWVGNISGSFNILDAGYAGVPGILLRHYIMRSTIAPLDTKYGGEDWAAPDPSLQSGGGQVVPNLAGTSKESARTILEGLGFGYEDGGEVDSSAPQGVVAQTDPAAGVESAKGIVVIVYTSKGNQKPFPDVIGKNYNDAKGELKGAGYQNVILKCIALEPEGDDKVEPDDPRNDKVQTSDPAAGDPVSPGATVTLGVGRAKCR